MKRKSQLSGQSLIEFALIIPWVLFLLLGFFDLGRAIIYYSNLSNAVREATRSGIVMDYTNTNVEDALRAEVINNAFILPNSPNITKVAIETKNQGGNVINYKLEIEANFCYVPITPFISSIIAGNCDDGQGFELLARSVMYLEPGAW